MDNNIILKVLLMRNVVAYCEAAYQTEKEIYVSHEGKIYQVYPVRCNLFGVNLQFSKEDTIEILNSLMS